MDDEGIGLDARGGLADVRLQVGEGLGRPGRPDADVFLDGVREAVVGEGGMPQSVWWMRMISSVPRRRRLTASERSSSAPRTA
ncbi:hypothetical protein ACFXDH_35830 [Streptomyces sp. NPDC059467]|uniref:hypothetical protein n=1 Tax=Streptomyces sp. NPDC059467 TaxID=3346844 RepID=UPI00368D4049